MARNVSCLVVNERYIAYKNQVPYEFIIPFDLTVQGYLDLVRKEAKLNVPMLQLQLWKLVKPIGNDVTDLSLIFPNGVVELFRNYILHSQLDLDLPKERVHVVVVVLPDGMLLLLC